MTSALSPPASNERVDHTSMPAPAPPPATGAGVWTQQQLQQQFRTTGPPSVEYNQIYPTPPSIEAFHPQQFSPQNLLLQHNSFPTETVVDRSPTDSVVEAPPVVVSRPQTAVYLTSSKFFGANCLKGRASGAAAALKYIPSPQAKLAIEATTPPAHAAVQQTPFAQASSIFPPQQLYGRQSAHPNAVSQQPALHQGHFGAAQPQSHLAGLMHYGAVPGHLNPSQPFGMGAPIMQRHPSFPAGPQGSPYAPPVSANPRTPGSSQPPQLVDIQSPLSNASSYMRWVRPQPHSEYQIACRSVNSVEAAAVGSCSVGAGASMPEAHGLVVALLMSDSVVDLHYDTSFDACPVCSCNSNIRGVELGVYLTPPDCPANPYGGFSIGQSGHTRCTCGFRLLLIPLQFS
jgi:hypothetical protein